MPSQTVERNYPEQPFTTTDPEFEALAFIVAKLNALAPEARQRVARYLSDRFT